MSFGTLSANAIRSLAALYHYLESGELLRKLPEHTVFKNYGVDASSGSFVFPTGISQLAVLEIALNAVENTQSQSPQDFRESGRVGAD
ncbi:MAG: hypothetical protein LBL59_01380 [Xanthomonadaceae bacterium]|jgi:hypothetical protein|nr:hypothetical protein [Xanthomonadaceae bacterium]